MEKIMNFNKMKIDENGTLIHYFLDEDEDSIKIPNNVKKIGSNFLCSYSDCVKEIFIPSSVTEIESSAFYNCKNLECIEFENNDSIATIGEAAFYGCEMLSTIVLSKQLKTISKLTFRGCSALKDLQIPESVEKIELGAFENCISLEQLIIPPNVKVISSYAFYFCSKLKAVTIRGNQSDKSRLIIEGLAFVGCKNLKTVNFPKETGRVYSKAFYLCDSLSEIYINENKNNFGFNEFDRNWDDKTGDFTVVFSDNERITKAEAKRIQNDYS